MSYSDVIVCIIYIANITLPGPLKEETTISREEKNLAKIFDSKVRKTVVSGLSSVLGWIYLAHVQ